MYINPDSKLDPQAVDQSISDAVEKSRAAPIEGEILPVDPEEEEEAESGQPKDVTP